jgi:hypothetical protein
MLYEVRGYASQDAFDAVKFTIIEDGLHRRTDALRLGHMNLDTFPIVKVQSDDREFIEILRRNSPGLDR